MPCPTIKALQQMEEKAYYNREISVDEWEDILGKLLGLRQQSLRWEKDYPSEAKYFYGRSRRDMSDLEETNGART